MTDATKAKVELVLLTLEWNQRRGNLPPPSERYVTPEFLADLSVIVGFPVSATTWREIEADGLTKLQLSDLALKAWDFLHKTRFTEPQP